MLHEMKDMCDYFVAKPFSRCSSIFHGI